MPDHFTDETDRQQYRGSFQELADARRVLKATNSIRQAPVLSVEDRLELERIRAYSIRCIEAATTELIETLDIALGDVDLEDDDPAEDNADREAIDEREPDHDTEGETWAHWMDHPAELHIGHRSGHTEQPADA